jgi:hypothetical protein
MEKKNIYIVLGIVSGVLIGVGIISMSSNNSNSSWLDDLKDFDWVSNNCNTKPWLQRDPRCTGR